MNYYLSFAVEGTDGLHFIQVNYENEDEDRTFDRDMYCGGMAEAANTYIKQYSSDVKSVVLVNVASHK